MSFPVLQLPREGSTIVFTEVPAGSWASPGVAYMVAVGSRTVSLVRTDGTHRGTFDNLHTYRDAKWTEVAPCAS